MERLWPGQCDVLVPRCAVRRQPETSAVTKMQEVLEVSAGVTGAQCGRGAAGERAADGGKRRAAAIGWKIRWPLWNNRMKAGEGLVKGFSGTRIKLGGEVTRHRWQRRVAHSTACKFVLHPYRQTPTLEGQW